MSSTLKELSKFEKEKQKLIQEKCQGLLNEMLRDDDNKYCVDCDAKGPRWASWNLGIFLCIRCAGIHRNLGVHISRVKSVNLDSWTPEQVVTMQQMGNSRARAVYEANLPDNFRRPQTDVALENFIRAKYEHTKYIAQEWVKPAPPRVDWNSEIEEQIRKKKEKNRAESTVSVLPKFGSSKINSSPSSSNKTGASQQQKKIPAKVEVSLPSNSNTTAPPPVQTSASDDLLGLTTGSDFVDPFASPVKSTNGGGGVVPAPTTEDDLGSVFTSAGGASTGDIGNGKMSKESILSLYGSLSGGGGSFAGGGVPSGVLGGATNNPFASGGVVGGQGFGGVAVPTNTNPFPQQGWGASGAADLGNGFGGLGVGQTAQSNLSQLQQGLFSLNLSPSPAGAAPPTQQQQNSNIMFNTNVPVAAAAPQSTNLNMLMMNSGSAVQPGGFFPGLTNTSISSPPHQMIPPAQQFNLLQQQQNVAFNQFQSATTVQGPPPANSSVGFGVNGASTAGTGNHVDLLWK